jgi:16S rRNA G1207 methylase RsmC
MESWADEQRHEALPSDEIKRRVAEKAALVAELEARNPRVQPEAVAALTNPFAPAGRITADGRKLAGLTSRAKKLGAIAEAAAKKAEDAKELAAYAREELSYYMRETGLL